MSFFINNDILYSGFRKALRDQSWEIIKTPMTVRPIAMHIRQQKLTKKPLYPRGKKGLFLVVP
jgi:hypothetical protein